MTSKSYKITFTVILIIGLLNSRTWGWSSGSSPFHQLFDNKRIIHKRKSRLYMDNTATNLQEEMANPVTNNNDCPDNSKIVKGRRKKRSRPRIPILQYHDDFVIVNKPAGISTHRAGHGTPRSKLVLSTSLKRQLSRKVFPVHRLDHRTSGAIMFAFDSLTCGLLHNSLSSKEKTSKKEYIALVRGDWKEMFYTEEDDEEEGGKQKDLIIVDKPLNVDGTLKEAVTEFRHLTSFSLPLSELSTISSSNSTTKSTFRYHPISCSLLLCTPKTGRTHQIRRHAFHLGLPIIGDTQHGDTKINRWWRENMGLDRLFLHSFALDIPHYDTEQGEREESNIDSRIQCVAPLSQELKDVLQRKELEGFWERAIQLDSRLCEMEYDCRDGTYGRNYKQQQSLED